MLRLICPICRKDSYSAEVVSFSACPYCGSIFSGKYGLDKRREERIKQEIPFGFSYQGRNLEASTVDFSEKGLGIKIFSELPVTVGDVVDFTIRDLRSKAKVMWIKSLPDKFLAGLERIN
jgi:Zn-finger nucleic acid-binding protein